MSTGVTAVVAQTKEAATALADELVLADRVWAFGARGGHTFVGLRANLVIIDAAADVDDRFMQVIRRAVAKARGKVKFVADDALSARRTSPAGDCAACDLYAVIDKRGNPASDFVADLVSVLPPRGHAFHDLAVWEQTYRRPHSVSYLSEER